MNVDNTNSASDQAWVGQQIGANFGTTVFHQGHATYRLSGDDRQERIDVAIKQVKAGMPRLAEEALRRVMRDGPVTARVAFYYALSLLGDRAYTELDSSVDREFRMACESARKAPSDPWTGALAVVEELMDVVSAHPGERPVEAAAVEQVLDRLKSLDGEIRLEIMLNVDRIVSGALQDALYEANARLVVETRMDGGRGQRAWKFFEPDPTEPRLLDWGVDRVPGGWRPVVAVVAALLGLVAMAVASDDWTTWLALPLLAGGGYLAFGAALERGMCNARMKRADREHGVPAAPAPPMSPGHWVSTAFVVEVHRLVEEAFQAERPHVVGDWISATYGVCEELKRRFVHLYGNAQRTPAEFRWLIRWHVRQVAERWRSGDFYAYRQALAVPRTVGLRFGSGVATVAVGLVVLLCGDGAIAAPMLGLAGFLGGTWFVARSVAPKDAAIARDEALRLHRAEHEEFERWRAVLADRPEDVEMGRWLELDAAYFRAVALRRFLLSPKDLVEHVVLTEGAPGADRARVRGGPTRYSAYQVLIFLLTKGGVRELEVRLDFLDGVAHDEQRKSFRYEALASARVEEVGARTAADGEDARAGVPVAFDRHRLHRRRFVLSLLDGHPISMLAEYFRGPSATGVESEFELSRLALGSSGIEGALYVLESVAAEGPAWIGREEDRRRRRQDVWRQGRPSGATPGISAPG
ncbi:hypothetical protein GCM10022243_31200 [Saccharothrix violaceirubra]|uniref:Uncharacterized protein n=1 Tax=Saccharothrix violaceirubra TaxID=413306 RepID=A0A7W7T554_9PSEU|nr:hypothetical protein [Saccharothrix violaceirubra]MBB4966745.1 hypothetical protein [Saccharothrix violaceirubra]